MSNPNVNIANLDGRYSKPADVAAAVSTQAVTDAGQYATISGVNTIGGVVDFLQFPGTLYGAIGVNASAFTQDAVTTAPNGDTYAVYWDSLLRPIVARYVSSMRTFQTFDLSSILNNPLVAPVPADGHNNIAIAIDGDGYIHIAGNHHDVPLRYIRSANPNDINTWSVPGMVGADETSVTYPQFVRLGTGDLLFFYRSGVSGNGDHIIDRYTKSSKTWARVTKLFQGTAPVSPVQCAYINRVVLDSTTGNLHLFYLWRQTDLDTSNHDISYIVSTDNGISWSSAARASMTLPIKPTDTAPTVLAGYTSGLFNQTGAAVDSNGIPHACWWLNTGSGPNPAELHHFYYSGGAWHNDVVTALPVSATRPGMWSYGGSTWAIYSLNGIPTSVRVSPTIGTPSAIFPVSVNQWECQVDSSSTGRFRTMLTPSRSDQQATWGGILSLDPSMLDGYPSNVVVPRPITPARLDPGFLAAGAPMLVGLYYSPAGVRDGNTVSVARDTMRAGVIIPGRSCVISNAAIRLTSAGGTGSQYYLSVYDALTNTLLAVSGVQDGTVTGVLTIPLAVRLTQGRPVYVGLNTLGSATVPQFSRLTGVASVTIGGTAYNIPSLNQPFIGVSSSSAATDLTATSNYVGVSATTTEGPPPSTFTPSFTSSIPNVSLLVSA